MSHDLFIIFLAMQIQLIINIIEEVHHRLIHTAT